MCRRDLLTRCGKLLLVVRLRLPGASGCHGCGRGRSGAQCGRVVRGGQEHLLSRREHERRDAARCGRRCGRGCGGGSGGGCGGEPGGARRARCGYGVCEDGHAVLIGVWNAVVVVDGAVQHRLTHFVGSRIRLLQKRERGRVKKSIKKAGQKYKSGLISPGRKSENHYLRKTSDRQPTTGQEC